MEVIEGVYVLCLLFSAVSLYITFSPKFYEPTNVIKDLGDTVLIANLPKARLNNNYGTTIPKDYVAKIQLAHKYVTLFNKSGNAIDIWAPKIVLAEKIFERAKVTFPEADSVIVND